MVEHCLNCASAVHTVPGSTIYGNALRLRAMTTLLHVLGLRKTSLLPAAVCDMESDQLQTVTIIDYVGKPPPLSLPRIPWHS
jgi:hypothetical protein